MEGTISTMDEIFRYEADLALGEDAKPSDQSVRSEVVETILYRRALKLAQVSIEEGRPLTLSLVK